MSCFMGEQIYLPSINRGVYTPRKVGTKVMRANRRRLFVQNVEQLTGAVLKTKKERNTLLLSFI